MRHVTPGRKNRQNILGNKSQQYFLRAVSQSKRNKSKYQQQDLIKLKNFDFYRIKGNHHKHNHSKENHHKMKRQPMGWEKIFPNDATDKGLISQIYKPLIKVNKKKKKNQPNQKMGRRPKQTFLQRR